MMNDTKEQFRCQFTIGFTYLADCYCYECGAQFPDIDPEGNIRGVIATWDRADLGDWACAECHTIIGEW